jgi:vancomycin resistance protein VanW
LAGKLRPDYGGGLCQLSGLIYYASLMAGLKILERHAHSRDIYDDQTRYAPLGSDATVAYGFKDLRVLNIYSFPVCFRVSITSDKAACQVCAPEPIEPREIEFVVSATGDRWTRVETQRRSCGQTSHEIVNVSEYRPLNAHGCEP